VLVAWTITGQGGTHAVLSRARNAYAGYAQPQLASFPGGGGSFSTSGTVTDLDAARARPRPSSSASSRPHASA
jgi:hypothetical protein